MYSVSAVARARQRGISLIEIVIGLCVMSVLLAIGVPHMSDWIQSNRATGAAEFYADGLRQARTQALSHNSASRLVLSENPASQQLDWQVDICFPTPSEPCNDDNGIWSTPAAPASNDPAGAAGYRSLVGSSSALPNRDVLNVTLAPAGADRLYFTPVGWVDQNVDTRLARLTLTAVEAGSFPSTAVAVTLAGMTVKCLPHAAAGDSRLCPP